MSEISAFRKDIKKILETHGFQETQRGRYMDTYARDKWAAEVHEHALFLSVRGTETRYEWTDNNDTFRIVLELDNLLGRPVPQKQQDCTATKHDNKKPRTDLLDPEFLFGLAAVLTHGAKTYGDHNWRNGMVYSRAYAALLRHLLAFWGGHDYDLETGLPHLDHAAAELMFLRTYSTNENYKGNDDRRRGPNGTK